MSLAISWFRPTRPLKGAPVKAQAFAWVTRSVFTKSGPVRADEITPTKPRAIPQAAIGLMPNPDPRVKPRASVAGAFGAPPQLPRVSLSQ